MEKICKKPEEYFGFVIWNLNNKLQSEIEEILGDKDVLYNHFMVLAALIYLKSIKKEPVNQKQLASYTKMREITISTIVRKLDRFGLLKIKKDKKDARSRMLLVTKKGADFFIRIITFIDDLDRTYNNRQTDLLRKKLLELF
jgi:DNA-binding MarR family transcriptional regulator